MDDFDQEPQVLSGIKCPKCGSGAASVKKTLPDDGFRSRIRQCEECSFRFWTHEAIGRFPLPYLTTSIRDLLSWLKNEAGNLHDL